MEYQEKGRNRGMMYKRSLKDKCPENSEPKRKTTEVQRKMGRERQRRFRLNKKLQQELLVKSELHSENDEVSCSNSFGERFACLVVFDFIFGSHGLLYL